MFNLEQLKRDPDSFGELLRRQFFSDGGFGCYSNFVLRDGIEDFGEIRLNSELEEDEDEYCECWRFAEWNSPLGKVEMRYYWDGDGTLEFILPDGSVLVNNDCKKYRGWELINDA